MKINNYIKLLEKYSGKKVMLKENNNNNILLIANQFVNNLKRNGEFDDCTSMCMDYSKALGKILKNKGYKVNLIKGRFTIDNPNEMYYDEWEEEELENDIEEEKLNPLHYWLEIDNNILDITATQFNDEIEDEDMPEIVFGSYEENWRYIKEKTIYI